MTQPFSVVASTSALSIRNLSSRGALRRSYSSRVYFPKLHHALLMRLFPSKCPPPFTQIQVFSSQVIAFVLPTSWVWHSYHASTSPSFVNTFAYSRVPSEHSSSPRFGSHVFHVGGAPTLLPQARLPLETNCFVGVDHRQSMLLAGPHCQHQRVLASIDVMKEH